MKNISSNYAYSIEKTDGFFNITLSQVKTGAEKHFSLVGGSLATLSNHMEGLTDDQCKMWFKGKG